MSDQEQLLEMGHFVASQLKPQEQGVRIQATLAPGLKWDAWISRTELVLKEKRDLTETSYKMGFNPASFEVDEEPVEKQVLSGLKDKIKLLLAMVGQHKATVVFVV
ncbi:MAG: hypothetical protein AB7F28_04195 [Candidatus Margulisiibacteriota bacterium]